ncbi:MAG: hypothetical protein ACP5MK_00060 [Candidatus Micrarchaeia archaeon]
MIGEYLAYKSIGIYITYSLMGIFLILSVFTLNAYVISLGVVACLVSLAYLKMHNVIEAIFLKKSRITVSNGAYTLNSALDAAVKKTEDGYEAISAAVLEPRGEIRNSEGITDIINKSKSPFEFSVVVSSLNAKKFIEHIETRRNIAEINLSKVGGDSRKSNAIRREIEMLDGEIASIAKGGAPMDITIRLKVFGHGYSIAEASANAKRSMEGMLSLFASSLGAGYSVLKGEDLLGVV